MAQCPEQLSRFLPRGHVLRYAPADDPEAKKPDAERNKNAQGGMNRREWLVCSCGNSLRVQDGPPTESDWLDLVNQCRLSEHSTKKPCPPVTLQGSEQVVRDAPPPPSAPSSGKGQPKKELAHAEK